MLYDNSEIIKGIKEHDAKVLNMIYRHMFPLIRQMVVKNQGTVEDIDDLYQDSMEVVYRKVSSGQLILHGRFSAYFLSVCRNIWFSELRRKSKLEWKLEFFDELMVDEAGSHVFETMEIKETLLSKVVELHLKRLDNKCQQILKLFFSGNTHAEISEVTGISYNYVKLKKHLCQKKLTKMIKNDPEINDI